MLEILDLLLVAPEAANRVFRSNAWLMPPTPRPTDHATARKAAIALATKRKIRLLSGGERRRPSVRPAELARLRGYAHVGVVPHECTLVRARRATWVDP